MNKFKVALVGLDNHIVPQWVYNEIRRYKISFLAKECTTKADLIKNANNILLLNHIFVRFSYLIGNIILIKT